MKPGYGEVLLAEGDVEVAEEEQRARSRSSAASSTRACGPPCRRPTRDGPPRGLMVQDFDEIPRDAERVIFFPRAAGGARPTPMLLALCAHWIVVVALSCRGRSCPRVDEALSRRKRAPRRTAPDGRLRPRPRAPRRAARPRAAALAASTRRSGRCTATSASSASGAADDPSGPRALRLPDLPAQADRRLRPADPPRCSTSTASSSRTMTRPYGRARLPDSDDVLAKWMALTGDEHGLIRRGEHAPARPPGRPARSPGATSGASANGSGAAGRTGGRLPSEPDARGRPSP